MFSFVRCADCFLSYVYCVVFGKKCGMFSVVSYVYCVVFGQMFGLFSVVSFVDCFLW